MGDKFTVKQLPDQLLGVPIETILSISPGHATTTLSPEQEQLVRWAIRLYNVKPMREHKAGERVEELAKIETLRRGGGLKTPTGKRSIAIPLRVAIPSQEEEDENVAQKSRSIIIQETREETVDGTEEGTASQKTIVTRHICGKNAIFILNEDVLIGIPKDGVPQAGDKYPDSMKMIIAKLGYVQE